MNRAETEPRKFRLRGWWLYGHLKEPAQGVKVLLQMIVGVIGSVAVILAVLSDIYGDKSPKIIEQHVLVIIAVSLAVAASLELAYTLFTPGPDEAIDPLMLGLSAVFLYTVSKQEDLTWTAGLAASLFAVTLAILFWIRQRFINDSDVKRDQSVRRASLEHEVEEVMGKPLAPAALTLLEIAEFAWHDRFGEVGLPRKAVQEILSASDQEISKMILLIKSEMDNY